MDRFEGTWEITFTVKTREDLLLALVVRDLLQGSSYDVDVGAGRPRLEVDYTAGDELAGDSYTLLVSAEVRGTGDAGVVRGFTAELLEELVGEAGELTKNHEKLGARPLAELELRAVHEDDERWDLVVPDWLAPDDAEVPFGFRLFVAGSEDPWPDNATLDAHGRVVVVPFDGTVTLYGVPAPEGAESGGPV